MGKTKQFIYVKCFFLHKIYVYIYIKRIHKIKKKQKKSNAYNVCHLRFVLNQATAKAKKQQQQYT